MIGYGMILQILVGVGWVEETLSTAVSGQISQAEVQLRRSCMSGNTTCGLTGLFSPYVIHGQSEAANEPYKNILIS